MYYFHPQNHSIDFRKNPVSKFILVGETNIQVVEVLKYEQANYKYVKVIYSEKATKFCEISTLLLSYVVPVKRKVEISQNFVAFSEYMNFTCCNLYLRGFD